MTAIPPHDIREGQNEYMIDVIRPFALALKAARLRLGEFPDQNDVRAIALRYITYDDLFHALSVYARSDAEADAYNNPFHAISDKSDANANPVAKLGPVAPLLADAVIAAENAMTKYPQPNYVISKWAEETGEVTKALIHAAEGRETWENLRGEIVQSLAMLHRLMVEGDQVHGLRPLVSLGATS